MRKAVVDLAKTRKIPIQASRERYMKCGIGICDACSLDDRLVCMDGPIFTAEQLGGFGGVGKVWPGKRGPTGPARSPPEAGRIPLAPPIRHTGGSPGPLTSLRRTN